VSHGMTDPIVLASAIAAIPATIAAVLSYLSNRRGKVAVQVARESTEVMSQAVEVAHHNGTKLDRLGNGLMDEKIRRCVKEVLDERGYQVTEAFIADVFGKVLEKHLDESGESNAP
jgi:hypothetical protein